jgi:8-amino-7-oxononanoate synthase
MTSMNEILKERLNLIRRKGLYRKLSALPSSRGRFLQDGRTILNFSTNDYLDLANHAEVRQAAADAALMFGAGATASRLMSGHLDLHATLETELAKLEGREAALVFGSGFLCNVGILTALLNRGDAVYADKFNHASLIDGVRLSGAESYRYQHNDPAHLETLLKQRSGEGLQVVVTESVFSMDGDLAPLADISRLAHQYGAMLVVDEAHAVGVFGARGGGLSELLPAERRPDLVVGTLGKALGSYGGFCAGSADIKDYLVNSARIFIFSTALPPAVVAAATVSARIIRTTPGLGSELLRRARFLGNRLNAGGFNLPEPVSQIIPIRIGDNEPAMALAQAIRAHGILVTAVRPPTVPAGTARLRLSVTLAHQDEDLAHAAAVITTCAKELKII